MRNIPDHQSNPLNKRIEITAGEPGAGGAPTFYKIEGFQNAEPAERWPDGIRRAFCSTLLKFQEGSISSAEDYNGLTNEAVLVVLIDRLQGFDKGPFRSRENSIALTHLEEALMWLQKRTRDREVRGVEGKQVL